MPDKKKPRKSKEKSREDRMYKHYKALKGHNSLEFVATRSCEGCVWSSWPHSHGYNKLTTPDHVWLTLATMHGYSIREVKDIVSRRRGWKPDKIKADRENAILVQQQTSDAIDKLMKEAGLR